MADDFRRSHAPHFRQSTTPFESTLYRLPALLLMLSLPLVHYGARVLIMVLFGLLGAAAAEVIWQLFARHEQTINDLNAVEIGLTCSLLMPACANYLLAAFTAAAAVILGKMPFGGAYRTPFVPSAVGYCLSAVCFPNEVFSYSQISERGTAPLAALTYQSYTPLDSPLAMLRSGRDPFLHINEYILGDIAGPLGTTSVLLIAIAAVWLWFGGGLAWQCIITFSISAAAVSFGLPYHTTSSVIYVLYDILGGSTLFCAVFMICCPNYAPKLPTARYLFGAAAGILAVLIQHFGANEAGGAFAALMLCPFAGAFDNTVWFCRTHDITYSKIKLRISGSIRESMKTKQERELDEIQ